MVRAYEDGMSEHDMGVIEDCFDPSFVNRLPDGTALEGRVQFLEFLSGFLDAFPDMIFTVEKTVSEGDMVAARWVGTGTHTHPYRVAGPDQEPIPASGRAVRFVANDIYRLADGKIVEEWNSLTDADVHFQLGALRPPAGD